MFIYDSSYALIKYFYKFQVHILLNLPKNWFLFS